MDCNSFNKPSGEIGYASYKRNEEKNITPKPTESDSNNNDCAAPILPNASPTQDKYLVSTESKYHSVNAMMFSDKVLQNEKQVCQDIIKYKKENGFDYNIWKQKIEQIDNYLFLELSKEKKSEKYKTAINNLLKKEKDLLFEMEIDSNLKEFEIPTVKERIINRILLIRKEVEEVSNLPEPQLDSSKEKPTSTSIPTQYPPP